MIWIKKKDMQPYNGNCPENIIMWPEMTIILEESKEWFITASPDSMINETTICPGATQWR